MSGEEFGNMFEEAVNRANLPSHVRDVILRLMRSIYKSSVYPQRGDFAKGREQMAMHAIALLLDSDWKTIEHILFDGVSDTDRIMLADYLDSRDTDGG
jgi:hypothetical protein